MTTTLTPTVSEFIPASFLLAMSEEPEEATFWENFSISKMILSNSSIWFGLAFVVADPAAAVSGNEETVLFD